MRRSRRDRARARGELGKKVAMCHLTLGEKGHPKTCASEYAALKREEAEAAAKVIGAKVCFLPYEDGLLPVNDEVKFAIAGVIRDCKPDLIITHHSRSIHKDHVSCHLNVPDAVFYAAVKASLLTTNPITVPVFCSPRTGRTARDSSPNSFWSER